MTKAHVALSVTFIFAVLLILRVHNARYDGFSIEDNKQCILMSKDDTTDVRGLTCGNPNRILKCLHCHRHQGSFYWLMICFIPIFTLMVLMLIVWMYLEQPLKDSNWDNLGQDGFVAEDLDATRWEVGVNATFSIKDGTLVMLEAADKMLHFTGFVESALRMINTQEDTEVVGTLTLILWVMSIMHLVFEAIYWHETQLILPRHVDPQKMTCWQRIWYGPPSMWFTDHGALKDLKFWVGSLHMMQHRSSVIFPEEIALLAIEDAYRAEVQDCLLNSKLFNNYKGMFECRDHFEKTNSHLLTADSEKAAEVSVLNVQLLFFDNKSVLQTENGERIDGEYFHQVSERGDDGETQRTSWKRWSAQVRDSHQSHEARKEKSGVSGEQASAEGKEGKRLSLPSIGPVVPRNSGHRHGID
eukprot:gnl/MRDRNA2_/MRDRNA2_220279_c0_seq1.p1 gnl/MRDRNA2_/MRDRNA2_220279_c0~~gnl/MRDRNA2_/MRDRNA2_220279_c0_seq1.p1  ORF type:complete len:421 (+),score=61.91 gnl/MRDRNA2_/MRDRNA2_220279_c0_seq1:22-1263(+)